jgi:hypothetical protein
MFRTSFYLPITLHQRLEWVSKQERKSISRVVSELLDKALSSQEKLRLARMYPELRKLQGACKEPLVDASTTINETLYGENGAWKGQRD